MRPIHSRTLLLRKVTQEAAAVAAITELTGMDPKAALAVLQDLPTVLKVGVPRNRAIKARKRFSAVGAALEIR